MFEYVCKNKKHIQAIWIAKNQTVYECVKKLGFPVLLYSSLKTKFLVARAKVNVQTESNEDTGMYRVARTKVIQLFHGSGAIKETFLYGKMSKLKKALVKIYADNHASSYWMVASEYYVKRGPVLYGCDPQKIKLTGQPRTDLILGKKHIKYFDEIKNTFPTAKLIVYTPTHRGFAQNSNLYMDEFSWNKLNDFFKIHNYILFFKPHPIELFKYIESFGSYSNIILVTSTSIPESSDINEYLHYFDMMISDYSSISSDFLPFDRPVIHYMYDRNTFEDENFKLNALEQFTAGPIVETLDDLMENIFDGIEHDSYRELRHKATQNAYKYLDTNNCDRVYNAILEILKE